MEAFRRKESCIVWHSEEGPWCVVEQRAEEYIRSCVPFPVASSFAGAVPKRVEAEKRKELARAYGLLKNHSGERVRSLEEWLNGDRVEQREAKHIEEQEEPVCFLGRWLKRISEVRIERVWINVVLLVLLGDLEQEKQCFLLLHEVLACGQVVGIRSSQAMALTSLSQGHGGWREKQLAANLAMDICVGFGLGAAVAWKGKEIGDMLYNTVGYALQSDNMESIIKWILSQHAPLGFKLNKRLDEVLGGSVLLIVELWHTITAFLAPYAPWVLQIAGTVAACGGGASLLIALACDATLLLTLQVQLLYNFFGRLHRFQLSGMSTCWHIIRGKKRNILRNRVDTGRFDTSQLLLGSAGFIVFTFLFQTTLAYYIVFAFLWTAILGVYGILYVLLELLVCLPVIALIQLTRDSKKFPSGVELHLERVDQQQQVLVLRPNYLKGKDFIADWLGMASQFWSIRFSNLDGSFWGSLLNGQPIRLFKKPANKS